MKVYYNIEFYQIKDNGVRKECEITSVHGWEEVFYTENLKKALKEFEDRKKHIDIFKDKELGATFSIWVDDVEVDQVSYEYE